MKTAVKKVEEGKKEGLGLRKQRQRRENFLRLVARLWNEGRPGKEEIFAQGRVRKCQP